MGQVLVVAAAVLVALALAWPLRAWGFLTRVESESMTPTLSPGQHVLTRRSRGARPPQRGDVVVVRSAELGRVVVKRVVGLGGEHVVVSAAGVRVDGRLLDEPYVVHRGGPTGRFAVPGEHLLLLGDNRARSNDSRSWHQPYLPVDAVRGFVVLSPRRSAGALAGRAPRPSRAGRAG